MEPRHSQKGLIAAIVFASTVVSASLVFSSMAFTGQLSSSVIGKPATTEVSQSDIDKKVADSIEAYAKQQGTAVKSPTVSNSAATVPSDFKKIDKEKDHIRGDKNARISIIEYSDYECGFCRIFHDTVVKLLDMDAYKGKVNWVYRHYPLSIHEPNATALAITSECVAEQGGADAFWKFTDAAFADTAKGGDIKAWAIKKAKDFGVNEAKLTSCLESNNYAEKVSTETSEGTSFGVRGTPGNFFVDNQTGTVKFIPGALPLERLKTTIDGMLTADAK